MTSSTPLHEAIFAMGCFWCGTPAFTDPNTNLKFPGILSVKAGYTGGSSDHPTYEDHEGHREAVQILYDPSIISYNKLLDIFWHNIDPLNNQGQFCDKGFAYTTIIYYTNPEQQQQAQDSKTKIEKVLGQTVATGINPASKFYDAEDYHQDYKDKNPFRYTLYKLNSGRDNHLKELWGAWPYNDEP